jgi:adenylate cyclase
MSDLQNRQAQVDMTTGQYNTQAQERAYDKDAADLAAQQTSQAQLFADMGKLGTGITRDYLLGQSQAGLMESAYNPYFRYTKQKGRNRYNTEYTG